MNMGEKIQSLRKARGWSQEKLAEQLNVTRQAVSRWESDSVKPDADNIVALCGLFDVSSDYLLGLERQEGEQNAVHTIEPKKENSYAIVIGIVFMALSVLAFVGLTVASAIYPCGYNEFEGLIGYVMCNDMIWFAVCMVLLFFCGLAVLFWRPVKDVVLKYRKPNAE